MSYIENVNKALDVVVVTDPKSSMSYVEPLWETILTDQHLVIPSDVVFDLTHKGEQGYEDSVFADDPAFEDLPDVFEMHEIIKAEVDKRNAINDPLRILAKSLNKMITEDVNIALEQENNDLVLNMLQYMQENHKLKEKDIELKEREKKLDEKEDVKEKIGEQFKLLTFAKKQ